MAVNMPNYKFFMEKCKDFICMIKAKLNAYIIMNSLQFDKKPIHSYIIKLFEYFQSIRLPLYCIKLYLYQQTKQSNYKVSTII